jgi:N-acetylglucosamine-6-phosphate deacetylase
MKASPEYFDLQVNGYGGVDFNDDDLTDSQLHDVCSRLKAEGVAGILATLITDKLETMCHRAQKLVQACKSDQVVRDVIYGIHLEGPFINGSHGYVGAHRSECVQPADVDSMLALLDACGGMLRIVTLAPEHDAGFQVTKRLAAECVVVSAGHTNASLKDLLGAIDAGLTMFTHLGNGCPKELDRHDNIIQRALSVAEHLWCCFIADGVHVPFFTLANYLKLVGADRAIVVTDAISAAGLGPGQYSVGGRMVEVDTRGVTTIAGDKSHLAGSAITMPKSAENLRVHLGCDDDTVHLLTSQNPRKAIGWP